VNALGSNVDLTFLALRVGFAGLLYLFLFLVALVAIHDLRANARERRDPEEVPQTDLGRLVVVESEADGSLVGQWFAVSPVTSIGRSPTGSIVLVDSYVSGDHALLSWRDGKWWLEDLKSTNGTFVNRERVRHPTEVVYGDLLQIGRTTLKLSR
jgi:pSer/pThr/pTyr-binding forkhead associated (FHA) protein